MRRWFAVGVFALAGLATLAYGWTPSPTNGMVAVGDAEAATLYGGGTTALLSGNSCSGTATGCATTPCYYPLEAGSRDAISKDCGASACGSVTDDNGGCSS
jgi:hypothetical protein